MGVFSVTKAEIKRLVDAAIEAARKNGVAEIEVQIDDAIVRIPLAPDKPVANPDKTASIEYLVSKADGAAAATLCPFIRR